MCGRRVRLEGEGRVDVHIAAILLPQGFCTRPTTWESFPEKGAGALAVRSVLGNGGESRRNSFPPPRGVRGKCKRRRVCMSKKGKAAAGVTVAAALAVTVGAGAAVAADMGYAPTTLGNSAYTNQVDVRNDCTVQAVRYTSCISNQNADSVDNAEGLSVKIGDASGDVSPIVVTNSLGKDIKELTFRTSDESSYPGNQLSATLADGQSAGWAFEYAYGERSYRSFLIT